MSKSGTMLFLSLSLALNAMAQGAETTTKGTATPVTAEKISFEVLKGSWARPDGGYTITIKNIAPSGQIEAMYFNPSQLPFETAKASREGMSLRAFFELRAGGYSGSTYELTYDSVNDRLTGIYYQAVAKQKFEVYFMRKQAAGH